LKGAYEQGEFILLFDGTETLHNQDRIRAAQSSGLRTRGRSASSGIMCHVRGGGGVVWRKPMYVYPTDPTYPIWRDIVVKSYCKHASRFISV
jgi:hypothetical protein